MKWISVNDQLPDHENEVLLYDKSKYFPRVTTGFFEHGQWRLFGTSYAENVTHWMPLPEPPKMNVYATN
jgi:hypothetical protein